MTVKPFDSELSLFVAEVTADLCRFETAAAAGCAAEDVSVKREVALGNGDYANIRVTAPGQSPLFVEIKMARSERQLVSRLAAKFGKREAPAAGERLAVVLRRSDYPDWPQVETAMRRAIDRALTIEIWDESELISRLARNFDDEIHELSRDELHEVRRAIEFAYWRFAFNGKHPDHPSMSALQWHFSPWALRRLHHERDLDPGKILVPGEYRDVIVLMADMCSFSSFVRDTPDAEIMRRHLTSFYSLARHVVLNAGGMVYQFVGDEVVALFGLHESRREAAARAVACARGLFQIGGSVAEAWQRGLDRVQPSKGVHIGIAVGSLNLLPLRPYSRTHVGFIGDALNMAARLMSSAGPEEIVASNGFYNLLNDELRAGFHQVDPLEAKNVGRILAYKMLRPRRADQPARTGPAI